MGAPGARVARGDAADVLLEPGQLLALPLLELLELALPLGVEALEGVRPRSVEALERVGDGAHHAERGNEGAEAVRAPEHGAGPVGPEGHLVLALTPEAVDRDLPLLRRRNREADLRVLDGRGSHGRRGGGSGRGLAARAPPTRERQAPHRRRRPS